MALAAVAARVPQNSSRPMEDSEIIEEFLKSQDSRLFEMLVDRYKKRVFRLVISILGPAFSGEAEEVTQEVFVLVFRRLSTFRGEYKFGTWLYRIAYNRAIDEKRKARLRLPHLSEDMLLLTPTLHNASNPLKSALEGERRRAIHACLEDLPDLYRSVLYLFYWMGCTIEEIGEYLTLNEGTVKSYLFRARERLYHRLKKKGIVHE